MREVTEDTVESHPPILMNPADEPELLWNDIYLDVGCSSLPFSDIPFQKSTELPDLFSDKGFVDDIEFLFDSTFDENDLNLEAASFEAEVDPFKEEKVPEASTSPQLSPSSTVTSPGSNNSTIS